MPDIELNHTLGGLGLILPLAPCIELKSRLGSLITAW